VVLEQIGLDTIDRDLIDPADGSGENTMPEENKMPDEENKVPEENKTKKEIKIQDLEPKKDAKGGGGPGVVLPPGIPF
jgi:hypothetical protein